MCGYGDRGVPPSTALESAAAASAVVAGVGVVLLFLLLFAVPDEAGGAKAGFDVEEEKPFSSDETDGRDSSAKITVS